MGIFQLQFSLLLPSHSVAVQDPSECDSPFAHSVSRQLFILFWSLIWVFLRLATQETVHCVLETDHGLVLIISIRGHLHSLGLGDTREHLQAEGLSRPPDPLVLQHLPPGTARALSPRAASEGWFDTSTPDFPAVHQHFSLIEVESQMDGGLSWLQLFTSSSF